MSDCGRGTSVRARVGIGVVNGTGEDGGGRFAAPEMNAFRRRILEGLTPHDKHGAICRSSGNSGSKFDGTGFENEHIGHIQFALRLGEGSAEGRWKGLSVRESGVAVALLDGALRPDIFRFWAEDRLGGFGTRVIFAEDFKKPA
jgi:hypothetical protein